MIRPKDLSGVVALAAAESTAMRKVKGETDTGFVRRIVAAYLNAEHVIYGPMKGPSPEDRQ